MYIVYLLHTVYVYEQNAFTILDDVSNDKLQVINNPILNP